MINKSRAFWGGVLLLVAAFLMHNRGGGIDILPSPTYDKVQFVLMDESSEPTVDLAVLVNSEQWQSLESRGVTTKRYDVTKDSRKPELEKLLKDMGDVKPPAILVYAEDKFLGVEASPSIMTLDSIVKKYTGK